MSVCALAFTVLPSPLHTLLYPVPASFRRTDIIQVWLLFYHSCARKVLNRTKLKGFQKAQGGQKSKLQTVSSFEASSETCLHLQVREPLPSFVTRVVIMPYSHPFSIHGLEYCVRCKRQSQKNWETEKAKKSNAARLSIVSIRVLILESSAASSALLLTSSRKACTRNTRNNKKHKHVQTQHGPPANSGGWIQHLE